MRSDESGRMPSGWRWGRRRRFVRTQDALTAIVPLDFGPEPEADLKQFLQQIGGEHVRSNPHIQFDRLGMPHFLSWVLIPGSKDEAEREGPPRLVFEANYQGPTGQFLDELHHVAGPVLKTHIYKHCGSPDWPDAYAFKDFFCRHALKPELLFQGYPGLTSRMIDNDDEVHWHLYRSLVSDPVLRNAPSDGGGDSEDERIDRMVRDCHERIQWAIRDQWCKDRYPLDFQAEPEKWFERGWAGTLVKYLRNLPVLPVLVVALLSLTYQVLLTALADWWAHHLKPKRSAVVPIVEAAKTNTNDTQTLSLIQTQEARQGQNHLALYTELKPGLLRRMTLRVVLFGWKYLARHFFTEGNLAGIEGIHFARWVIVESGSQLWPNPKDGRPRLLSLRRKRYGLLFLSNYDGSWESYLDNFIDRASSGLTTIWCNTMDFPKTRLQWNTTGRFPYVRVVLGAQREEEFKQWVRRHQVPTNVWFSQHPDKSVSNIRRNWEIRSQATVKMDARRRKAWLELL